jgi:hypothetical protein
MKNIQKYLPLVIGSLALLALAQDANAQAGGIGAAAETAKGAIKPWLSVAGYAMIGGASLCFIYAAYEAFQREWTKMGIALLVCVLLGFGPLILKPVYAEWTGETPTSLLGGN